MPHLLVACLVLVFAETAAAGDANAPAAADKPIRLLICSGQSNMPTTTAIGVRTALEKSFPDEQILLAHVAKGGLPIILWSKLPEHAGLIHDSIPAGGMYDKVIAEVTKVLAGRQPKSLAFCWLQGEAERGNVKTTSEGYASILTSIITRLRSDLGRDDLDAVIARISDAQNNRPAWKAVREGQVAVAANSPRCRWIDTDDAPSGDTPEKIAASIAGPNDIHYNQQGRELIARRFAAAVAAAWRGEPEPADPNTPSASDVTLPAPASVPVPAPDGAK
ncbi:hypothetical protein LBMAG53_16730 [Planctomycetota bacterium]|nr:hypothetical protein LBMAG53_16730 [Planctomycetota bacterium]